MIDIILLPAMGYDSNECALCYALGGGNVPLDDDDQQHVCHACIGRLCSMENRIRFTSGITQEQSYSDACFLCGTVSTSGYMVSLCSDHENDFAEDDEPCTIYVLKCGSETIGYYRSEEKAQAKILEEQENGNEQMFTITEVTLE